VTARLDQIAPRLKKLLLMLSSDREGEVVNAARLIGSTLQDAGHDWHDLAGALTELAVQPQRDSHAREHRDSDSVGWREQRAFCLEHVCRLRDREREFIDSLGRWRGPLTEKQASWLSAIYQRIRRTT
jgi:hypothetical protein